MIAFKFLSAGAVGPFTGFRWTPGAWVSAPPGGGEGSGVHACRVAHLPYWVADELWRIELDGAPVERSMQIEARRGRLADRVTAWDAPAFADACAQRARAYATQVRSAEVDDYAARARRGMAGSAGFMAAVAAVAALGHPGAFAEERAWQARWLADALSLRDDAEGAP